MKSSYLTNLTLLILVLGLFWLSQHDSKKASDLVSLSSFKIEEIQEITIQRHNTAEIKMTKEADGWNLNAPFTARANQTRVKLLLSLLDAPIHGQFHPLDEHSLSQFGLSNPEVKIKFNHHEIAFGGIDPIEQYRYVMTDNIIYLIDDMVMPLLKSSASNFIDNQLITENNRLIKLELPNINDQLKSETLTITKTMDHWQSNLTGLTTDQIVTTVEAWQHAQASQVLAPKSHVDLVCASDITLWFENSTKPKRLELKLEEQSMLIKDCDSQFQYVLPRALHSQLFPN